MSNTYSAKILKDSLNPNGLADCRLTTFEVTFPRFLLAEFNTHRMFSRNSASSRAIPTEKLLERVDEHPFVPTFNARVKGMGVGEELSPLEQSGAQSEWLAARDFSADVAAGLLHTDKSRANRLLEPFMWHTAIVTATDWGNFWALRMAAGAQPEFIHIAEMMKSLYDESHPLVLPSGYWHLPLVTEDEVLTESLTWPEPYVDWEMWAKVSVGRCARVSYLTHDGQRDLKADVQLHDKLKVSRHLSPFEHVARPFTQEDWDLVWYLQSNIPDSDASNFEYHIARQLEYHGNLHGWHSKRTEIFNEHDASLI